MIFYSLYICSTVLNIVYTNPNQDKVLQPPGFNTLNFQVYSGYLETTSFNRQLHYLFFTSQNNSQNDPIILWLNGGPGCSSMLGAFDQIGPFLTNNTYKIGDSLILNQHSWNKHANLLFLQSPAGVGFSIDQSDNYTDSLTAQDNYAALKYFFNQKFPSMKTNKFFIAGQSYAGKYIPDLARLILNHQQFKIQGILVGNGVFSFLNDQLEKSQIQYLITHNYIELQYRNMFMLSCKQDWNSPRCEFFKTWFHQLRSHFNVYNIFDVCKPPESQQLDRFLYPQNYKNQNLQMKICYSQLGLQQYMNAHRSSYNIKSSAKNWTNCNHNIHYKRDDAGSILSYRAILDRLKILIFSGDFDDQVPLVDTFKNIHNNLKLEPIGQYKAWFNDDQHAGFVQLYHQNLTLVTVKGAGHMVPQDKRGPAYQMFYNFVNDKPINTPISTNIQKAQID